MEEYPQFVKTLALPKQYVEELFSALSSYDVDPSSALFMIAKDLGTNPSILEIGSDELFDFGIYYGEHPISQGLLCNNEFRKKVLENFDSYIEKYTCFRLNSNGKITYPQKLDSFQRQVAGWYNKSQVEEK